MYQNGISFLAVKSAATRTALFWIQNQASFFSQDWFATPQLVLQADWQEVWHSPQPPLTALWHRLRVSKVLILSIIRISDLLNL
jgi:hypothetical protein